MTTFWANWIMFLVVLNLGITFFLFIWSQRVRLPVQEDGTSGHVWAHGVLRESVRTLPRWWVVMSASMFVAGVIYLVLYPGFGRNEGILGWTQQGELARDVAANAVPLNRRLDSFRAYPIEQLAHDPAATTMGRRLFVDNCAACHGMQAEGNQQLGAPDLVSGSWLYGGDADAILASILDGRQGTMPPFGPALGDEGVSNMAQYVLSLSGLPHDAASAKAAEPQFAVCSACHGADGSGNQALGAPDLTDDVWVYGNNVAVIEQTIREGRSGVMPAWRERLGEDQARIIAAWVYGHAQAGEIAAR